MVCKFDIRQGLVHANCSLGDLTNKLNELNDQSLNLTGIVDDWAANNPWSKSHNVVSYSADLLNIVMLT